MLGIMLRAFLHVAILILLLPVRIAVLLYLLVDSIKQSIKGIMTFREYWGYVWQGMKEVYEVDMDIIRNGF